MAHALRLINIVANEEFDFYDQGIMEEFEKEAKLETVKILNSHEEVSIFRNYSTTYLDEFFAVSIECFFEIPEEFKNYNLKLYQLLTMILKLNPAELYSNSFKRITA
jgi:MtfA peptidase